MRADLVPNTDTNVSDEKVISHFEVHQGIADQMEALAIELRSIPGSSVDTVPSPATLQAVLRKVYSARRKVDEIFGMQGFAVSPAWDIMMDLYQALDRGKAVSITSACIGSACPPTTALRWLQALENMQLIERSQDAFDKRRSVVTLTEGAKVKIASALAVYL
ncbi:hypothetical protein CHX26_09185 [Porphyrobacter sp. HT-58-2]|uniref:MarR family winged helix-turn-helix transcriptional regulator n=1 Tax=Porphyrobacter sp. HT-58-2 TaxID=2023229 RepID=UPI000CDC9608|nr:MarR family winged helix-turn-helix transcriptional regulator [Porphyrobacter sp. HT-58-2]AUX69645.1 hypothetical protein CHX26_09185 [Porphyrobacter sp. HT-58-2]